MEKALKSILSITIVLNFGINTYSQSIEQNKNELVLLAGTIQPFLLQGGNFEVDFYTSKMVFNYSHGFSLDMNSEKGTTVGEVKEQSLAIHLPYSTGFGIGYRLNKYFDVRIETKMHKFNIYYDSTDRKKSLNQITDYRTITVGLGGYFRWKPFEKNENWTKGIFTSTSLRFWPKVSSSLKNGEVNYYNRITLKNETHKTANIGIANSPIIFNFSIGYSVQF